MTALRTSEGELDIALWIRLGHALRHGLHHLVWQVADGYRLALVFARRETALKQQLPRGNPILTICNRDQVQAIGQAEAQLISGDAQLQILSRFSFPHYSQVGRIEG